MLKLAIPLALITIGHIVQVKSDVLAIALRILGFVLLGFNISLVDLFSDMLIVSLLTVGAIVTAYTVHYSRHKYGNTNLTIIIDLFTISMFFVFTSRYLVELITFWLLTELLGFFLIAYDYIAKGDTNALTAATRYLLLSMIPTDIALFILLALTGLEGAFSLPLKTIAPQLTDPLILTMIMLGFFSKAAIFPLHFWLPDAHSIAPAPASALLSGLMVKMGVYALYLLSLYPIDRGVAVSIMLFSGFLTALYGAIQASLQQDIKRLLAYSTTSNTALITVAIALYIMSLDKLFLEAAILYTVAHALYKAFMFLDAGFIEVLVHERDIRRLGYVAKISPMETAALLIAILSMFGMPPSTGFLAKVFLFTAISKYLTSSWIYIATLILASIKVSLAIVYNIVYLKTHLGAEVVERNIPIDEESFKLQPFTLTLSLSTFIPVMLLSIATYVGFIELKLIEKLGIQLITSAVVFLLTCLLVYSFKKPLAMKGYG